jgi:hypothetical protein
MNSAGPPVARQAPKSVRKGKACEPARTIQGVLFVPARDDEVTVARGAVEGSRRALANQNIILDVEIDQFLELGDLAFSDKDGDRSVDSYGTVCSMMRELVPRVRRPGIVVLMVPISGEICQGHGSSCYVPDFGSMCPSMISLLGRVPERLIILGRFNTTPTTLAHELGHHAGQPQRRDPRTFGHEEYDPHNYMGFNDQRDHYRDELLDRMCSVSFQF